MEIKTIQKSLHDAFGIDLEFSEWAMVDQIPLYLSKSSFFFIAKVEPRLILLICLKETQSFTEITNITKQVRRYLQPNTEVLLVLKNASSYLRKKLIESRIAFIRADQQIYAPFLGLIYSEKARTSRSITLESQKIKEVLPPSALSVYLHMITSGIETKQQQEIADDLKITRMTLHRAYKELVQAKLILKDEKTRKYHLPQDWKIQLKNNRYKFDSPIRHTFYVNKTMFPQLGNMDLIWSSESALSQYTLLGEPTHDTVAVDLKTWKRIKDGLELYPTLEEEALIVEVWSIRVPSQNNRVLPIGLYFAMKDEPDPRITLALDQMMKDELNTYD